MQHVHGSVAARKMAIDKVYQRVADKDGESIGTLVDVGDGYCQAFHALSETNTVITTAGECLAAAKSAPACKDKR